MSASDGKRASSGAPDLKAIGVALAWSAIAVAYVLLFASGLPWSRGLWLVAALAPLPALLIPSKPLLRHERSLAALLVGAFVIAHLCVMDRWPIIYNDEPWEIGRAHYHCVDAQMGHPDDATVDDSGAPPDTNLQIWTLGAFLRILGTGLWQARLMTLCYAAAVLVLTYAVARRLANGAAALAALLVLAANPWFNAVGHVVRPDVPMLAWSLGGLLCILKAFGAEEAGSTRNAYAWAAGAGACAGVSTLYHLNGALFTCGLAGVCLVRCRAKALRSRTVWAFVLGGVPMLCVFVFWNLGIPALRSTSAPSSLGQSLSVHHRPAILAMGFREMICAEGGRFVRFVWTYKALAWSAWLFAGAAFAYFLHREKRGRAVWTWLVVFVVLQTLLSPNKHPMRYVEVLLPALCIILALWFPAGGVSAARRGVHARCAVALAAVLGVAVTAGIVRNNWGVAEDYRRIGAALQSVVPPGAKVISSPAWWLALRGRRFRAVEAALAPMVLDGKSFGEVMQDGRYDYIVEDKEWREFLSPGAKHFFPMWQQACRRGPEIEGFVRGECEPVAVIRSADYGDLRVFSVKRAGMP